MCMAPHRQPATPVAISFLRDELFWVYSGSTAAAAVLLATFAGAHVPARGCYNLQCPGPPGPSSSPWAE